MSLNRRNLVTHRVYSVPGDGPTIVVLHSANTTPEQMAALVGPIPGFNVIYPQAAAITRWDHLGSSDAPFLKSLGGDYVAGFSSGAFMAFRMALRERQYRGMASDAGGLIKAYVGTPWPYPCPVLLCHGTADQNVPYNGTALTLGAVDTANRLAAFQGVSMPTLRVNLSDSAPMDGCTAYVDYWADKVKLYTVMGGGHTWPGSAKNLPVVTGATCMDFSLTAEIANFFGPAQMARAA